MHKTEHKRPLRAQLEHGTRALRDRLERTAAGFEFAQPADYARFLRAQLRAREAIEDWADRHCPGLLRPPSTTWLLREDLARLAQFAPASSAPAASPPAPLAPFVLPADCDPLGLAWAIACSHLSNRAILARILEADDGAGARGNPTGFLADKRMTSFWHRLVPRLQEPVAAGEAEPALAAASAVLARFEQALAADRKRCRQAA